jgi:hypothetical protein
LAIFHICRWRKEAKTKKGQKKREREKKKTIMQELLFRYSVPDVQNGAFVCILLQQLVKINLSALYLLLLI